jgi:hypothetical protein
MISCVLALALALGLAAAPAAATGPVSEVLGISVTFREAENGVMALDFRVHNVRSDTYAVYFRFDEAVVHSVKPDGTPAFIAEGYALMAMPNGDIATDESIRDVINTDPREGWNYIQVIDIASNYYYIAAGAIDKGKVERLFGGEPGYLQLTPPDSGLNLYTLYFKLNEGKTPDDLARDTFRIESDSTRTDAKDGIGIIAAGYLVATGLEWINFPGKTAEDNHENDPDADTHDPEPEGPGGGTPGGNPSNPSNPTPPVSPGLNTTDHFRYIYGFVDNTVRPDNNITREEVAAIFYRLLTPEYRKATREYGSTFPDVAADHWAAVNIGTMQRAKVITGYPDGTFGPANNITRGEFAAVVTRFGALSGTAVHSFSDVSGHWAEQYIAAAAENGWITGYPDGTFQPDRPISRVEVMVIINRVLDRKVDAAGVLAELVPGYTDLASTHWAYYDILEATVSHVYERRSGTSGVENWKGPGEDFDFDAD